MSSPKAAWRWRALLRAAPALLLAALLAGCFQPLYGERSVGGGPGLRHKLAAVEVAILNAPNGSPEARVGVEVRNSLLFDFTGGSGSVSPTHRLAIVLKGTRSSVIVDTTTARAEVENYGIDAVYTLTELATGKVVANGTTFSRVSYDIPGQQQRFARQRGLRDAEDRAAKVIAEQIKTRVAAFFVAGS